MRPRFKFGLLFGGIGLLLVVCVASAFGICGPVVSLVAGAAAGFFAAQGEKLPTKGEGARSGAISGAVAGALVFIGQLIGGVLALVFVQYTGMPVLFGTAPTTDALATEQLFYYAVGLGTGTCFGVVGVTLAVLAGAGCGYLGTPETRSYVEPGQMSG